MEPLLFNKSRDWSMTYRVGDIVISLLHTDDEFGVGSLFSIIERSASDSYFNTSHSDLKVTLLSDLSVSH